MAFDLGTLQDGDLDQLSDGDLAELEDQLLLETELDTGRGAQFTAGRLFVWGLRLFGLLLALALYSRLMPVNRIGPLAIPVYLLFLAAGVLGAERVWRGAGRPARMVVRGALVHWPVVLYLVAIGFRLLHRGAPAAP